MRGKVRKNKKPAQAPQPEVTEVEAHPDHVIISAEEPAWKKRFKRPGKKGIVLAVLVVAAAGAGVFLYQRSREESAPAQPPSAQQLKIKDTTNVEDVVKRYGQDYDDSSKEITNKNYTEWDKTTLDKAYFSLLYADKAGLFTQVYQTLALIEGAKMNGLNVDDNGYGIGQAERDAIKQRADKIVQEELGGNQRGEGQ